MRLFFFFTKFVPLSPFIHLSKQKEMMLNKFVSAAFFLAAQAATAEDTPLRGGSDSTTKTEDRDLKQKIVGGRPALDGEYPSYAVPRTGNFGNGLCGSVKIWDDILLSAAHCYGAFAGNDMFIGGNRRSGSDALETIAAVAERPHPSYNDGTLEFDFLLIKLAEASVIASSAPWNTDESEPEEEDIVTVMGFGTTSEGGFVSNELLEVDVAIVDSTTCNTIYQGTIYEETMICAYRSNADSCQGDRYVRPLEARGRSF